MKKSYFAAVVVIVVILVVFLVLSGAFYAIDQTEQVIITQFGQPVGDPITGCHPYEGQDIHPSRRIRALAH